MNKLIYLETRNFLGAPATLAVLLFLFATGLYGIHNGRSTIEKQRAVIATLPEIQRSHREHELALNPEDLGNLLYSLQFPAVDEPSAWSAFSIGQRDVNPYILRVRMLTLEGQLYESDLANPVNLLYGNFDPAFVIVFLFPLAIIAFCYNVVSDDREGGIWNLLRAQPFGTGKLVVIRIAIRFVTVAATAALLIFATAFVAGSAAFDVRLAITLLVAIIYLLFWTSVAALVVSFAKTTAFNALSLLAVWILLAVIGPALANLAISTALPVSESFDVTVTQREGYHRKWDAPKSVTMEPFYELYPQFRSVPIPEDKFSWAWYYAMQNAGDVEAANARNGYAKKLAKRDAAVQTAASILPTVRAQLAFNEIGGTDLETHLAFLDSVRDLHRAAREFFYPLIFNEAKTGEVEWDAVPRHQFSARRPNFPSGMLPMLIAALFMFGAARMLFKSRLA